LDIGGDHRVGGVGGVQVERVAEPAVPAVARAVGEAGQGERLMRLDQEAEPGGNLGGIGGELGGGDRRVVVRSTPMARRSGWRAQAASPSRARRVGVYLPS